MVSATVSVEEATGDITTGTSIQPTSFIHILGIDERSLDANHYLEEPLRTKSSGAITFSPERWFRLKFTGTFLLIREYKFWMNNLVIPVGWTIKYGVTDTFTGVTNQSSAIAVNDIPTTEGTAAIIGGPTLVNDSATRYSDWVVVQASVSGEATQTTIHDLDYRFSWMETVTE